MLTVGVKVVNTKGTRIKEIYSQLHLDKLPFNLSEEKLSALGLDMSNFFTHTFAEQKKSDSLKWCFGNVKRIKVFNTIIHAEENNEEIYKEKISQKIPEYSYKTIAKIIDEGVERGYFISLNIDGKLSRDSKVKNIKPSLDLLAAYFNMNIEIISYINELVKKNKVI